MSSFDCGYSSLLNISFPRLCFLLMGLFVFSFQPADAAQICFKLQQKHYVSGSHVILVCPTAIKIMNTTQNYELISKAPNWNVEAFRNDDKVICHLTLKQFFEQFGFNGQFLPRSFNAVGSMSVGVLPVVVYENGQNQVWISRSQLIPVQAQDLVCAYYRCNRLKGLPLKFTTLIEPGDTHSGSRIKAGERRPLEMLDTVSTSKTFCHSSEFVIPKEYKVVMRAEEITTSRRSRNQADAIFQEMGLGEPFGAKKSK